MSSVYAEARGMDDNAIIQKAYAEDWILMSNNKDFGEKVYRERHPHKGVILLRFDDERADVRIRILNRLLKKLHRRIAWAICGR